MNTKIRNSVRAAIETAILGRPVRRRLKVLSAVYAYTDEDGDNAVRTLLVPMSARDRKIALRNRRDFATMLAEYGYVDEPGCDCSHCANDWDCCGRMVPQRARVVPARHGVRIEQAYHRNV